MNPSIDALSEATRRRTRASEEAVQRALRHARKTGEPVTFKSIARAAGVSTDFLYDHPELRTQVEALRRRRPIPSQITDHPDVDAAASVLVHRLSQQISDLRRQHRQEVAELRQALEAAHGELLHLRRQLDAGYDPGR